MKKCTADHRNRVAEETSEHKPPECRGNAAEKEHSERFVGCDGHILILVEQYSTDKGHDNTVSRITQHHSEQEIIKAGHNKRWINFALARQAERLQHPFYRGSKAIVFQQHRHVIIFGRIRKFNSNIKIPREFFFQWGRFFRRNITAQKENPFCLYQASNYAVLVIPHRIVIRQKLQIASEGCKIPNFCLLLFHEFFLFENFFLQQAGLLFWRPVRLNRRPHKSCGGQSGFHLCAIFFLNHQKQAGLFRAGADDLGCNRAALRRISRKKIIYTLLRPFFRNCADKSGNRFCTGKIQRYIQRKPRL